MTRRSPLCVDRTRGAAVSAKARAAANYAAVRGVLVAMGGSGLLPDVARTLTLVPQCTWKTPRAALYDAVCGGSARTEGGIAATREGNTYRLTIAPEWAEKELAGD